MEPEIQSRIHQLSTEGIVKDVSAFERAVDRRAKVSFAMAMAGLGTASFLLCCWVLTTSSYFEGVRQGQLHKPVDPNCYMWPMVAFGTAFLLNFMTLLFERESAKFQLALLACYINFLAGLTDYMCWKGYLPIIQDSWGQGVQISRMLMWLHTTPAMVYLLSIISDLPRGQVLSAMCMDVIMLVFGMMGHLMRHRALSCLCFGIALSCFCYVIDSLWRMFNVAVNESCIDSSRLSLEVLRLATVGLWFAFPITFMLVKLDLVDFMTEEWLWCAGDFLGKVMFSSSLLHGNFLTIEQRRLIAMRVMEEGNRDKWAIGAASILQSARMGIPLLNHKFERLETPDTVARIQVIEELKELVAQKEQFMSSMSHELRTPLNGIIGLSDALLVGSCGPVSDAVHKTINTIKTSGARLLNLINDILDAASMRQGKLTIKLEKVNLQRIVQDVVELCQPLAKHGVKLVNDVRDNTPPALGDTGRIIQIFHNLIGNSCKFTHSGFISVSATVRMDEIEVAVSDTGIGIPEDKYDQIFIAFEQVDMSITRKYGGTGLGLSLVKQLVEAHGGTIHVKSQQGSGTTFYFTFPLWDEEEHGDDNAPAMIQGPPSNSQLPTLTHHTRNAIRRRSSNIAQIDVHPARRNSMDRPGSHASGASSATGAGANSGSCGGFNTGAYPAANIGVAMAGPAVVAAGQHRAAAAKSASLGCLQDVAAGKVTAASSLMPATDVAALVQDHAHRRRALKNEGRVRVLSVDDDPVNQLVIQNLLAPVGYEIIQAMDGQEALQILADTESTPPDVILLDVMMPGMSGYEVCRRLRDLYPLTCIPVIMISAKSKEEHIVEGLAAGSNDYVVKPFGRQEILARIAAHLRFRDEVFTAGEAAGHEAEHASDELKEMMKVESRGYSLPPAVRAAAEASSSTLLQNFEQLTMVVVRLLNIHELTSTIPPGQLLHALARIFTQMDNLLEANACYLVEGVEERLVVVSGLTTPVGQVAKALAFVTGLLAAADEASLPDGKRIVLSIGVHTSAAQGVVVGVAHPVMYFPGPLAAVAGQLQVSCPPGCILVSARVLDGSSNKDLFCAVPGGASNMPAKTYLLKAGNQWEEGLMLMQRKGHGAAGGSSGPVMAGGLSMGASLAALTEASGSASGSGEALNTDSRRVGPGQLAMMTVFQAEPTLLVTMLSRASAALARAAVTAAPSDDTLDALTHEKEALEAQLGELKHEHAMLEAQLEEVSEEAARLQDVVDGLEAELVDSRAVADTTASTAESRVAVLNGMVTELQRQLTDSMLGHRGAEMALRDVEARLEAAAARENAHQNAQDMDPHAWQLYGNRPSSAAPSHHRLGAPMQLHSSPGRADSLRHTHHVHSQLLNSHHSEVLHVHDNPLSSDNNVQPPSSQQQGDAPSSRRRAPRGSDSFGAESFGVTDAHSVATLSREQSISNGQGTAYGSQSSTLPRSGMVYSGVSPAYSMGDAAPVRLSVTASDMRGMLEELGLPQLIPRFEAEEVTPALLPFLDDNAMRELGASSLGTRLKLRIAAQSVAAALAGGQTQFGP